MVDILDLPDENTIYISIESGIMNKAEAKRLADLWASEVRKALGL
jgi:hypothetical protein